MDDTEGGDDGGSAVCLNVDDESDESLGESCGVETDGGRAEFGVGDGADCKQSRCPR